ncbi:MAG: hypothetical protein JXA19_03800 [Anaerolineales bacterium]|nr:hypothetical protein [Anaerolineales bacterium]
MEIVIVLFLAFIGLLAGFLLGNLFPFLRKYIIDDEKKEMDSEGVLINLAKGESVSQEVTHEEILPQPEIPILSPEPVEMSSTQTLPDVFQEITFETADPAPVTIENRPSGPSSFVPTSEPSIQHSTSIQPESRSVSPLDLKKISPIVSFWRDPITGVLSAKGEGFSFQFGEDLNEKIEKELLWLSMDLQQWLALQSDFDDLDQKIKEREMPKLPDLPKKSAAGSYVFDLEAEEKRRSVLGIFTDAIQVANSPSRVQKEVSIIGQINAILQHKIVDSPLDHQGIELTDGPEGGMNIKVGLNTYTEIGQVPSEEIRNVIRESVKDWENSVGE